jgi:hypothetical protein
MTDRRTDKHIKSIVWNLTKYSKKMRWGKYGGKIPCVSDGTQKLKLLNKAGSRVVYFGYKHQRNADRNVLRGVVKKYKK